MRVKSISSTNSIRILLNLLIFAAVFGLYSCGHGAEEYSVLGNTKYKSNYHDGSIADLTSAIQLNPQSSAYHDNLGLVYYDKGDKDDYVYPHNPKISNRDGVPVDSKTIYFPKVIKTKNQSIKTGINYYIQKSYSHHLFAAKEPILYNYYLGRNVYRFTWLRSFDPAVYISLNRDSNDVWLTVKISNYNYIFNEEDYTSLVYYNFLPTEIDSVLLNKDFKKLPVSIRKKLSLKEWDEFDKLINKCDFWNLRPSTNEYGIDGSEWIIEAHMNNIYWFVERWCGSKISDCGEYLIKLCGITGRIY